MPEHYEIRIRKEALKFAASHMTVFPDGSKEALHGHQYQPTLTVQFKSAEFKKMVPFAHFKNAMKILAGLWDEKVLLATKNPHFKVLKHSKKEMEFTLCGKRYVIPSDEIVCLKTDNITCETLARCYFEFLKAELEDEFKDPNVLSVQVYIEESPGQGAAYTYAKR